VGIVGATRSRTFEFVNFVGGTHIEESITESNLTWMCRLDFEYVEFYFVVNSTSIFNVNEMEMFANSGMFSR
jgi:hypothetical protein